jgi:hypothetical protein
MTPAALILAGLSALEETMKFLNSPEGQLALKEARENREEFAAGAAKFWTAVTKPFELVK